MNAEFILEFKNGCCVMESGARFPVRVRDSARVEQMASDYHLRNTQQTAAQEGGMNMDMHRLLSALLQLLVLIPGAVSCYLPVKSR